MAVGLGGNTAPIVPTVPTEVGTSEGMTVKMGVVAEGV